MQFELNGTTVHGTPEPRMLLCDFIRDSIGLTGTKVGCEQGACGACTVLLDGAPVRSCLLLAIQAEGHEVTTIEGLCAGPELSPLQRAFHQCHALQCGFCTAGFLVTLTALFRTNPHPTEFEISEAIAGHLCRCTGYAGILAAARHVAAAKD